MKGFKDINDRARQMSVLAVLASVRRSGTPYYDGLFDNLQNASFKRVAKLIFDMEVKNPTLTELKMAYGMLIMRKNA